MVSRPPRIGLNPPLRPVSVVVFDGRWYRISFPWLYPLQNEDGQDIVQDPRYRSDLTVLYRHCVMARGMRTCPWYILLTMRFVR